MTETLTEKPGTNTVPRCEHSAHTPGRFTVVLEEKKGKQHGLTIAVHEGEILKAERHPLTEELKAQYRRALKAALEVLDEAE